MLRIARDAVHANGSVEQRDDATGLHRSLIAALAVLGRIYASSSAANEFCTATGAAACCLGYGHIMAQWIMY